MPVVQRVMKQTSQVEQTNMESESLLALAELLSEQPRAWGWALRTSSCPPPLHPLLLPAFPGSPFSPFLLSLSGL